ncbi:MAG: HEAT repeat domain-containing protein [Bacteroidota bacterium]
MNHDHYREWLLLSLYGELDPLQQETLDEHLKECAGCRAELGHLKTFNQILSQRKTVDVDNQLLQDARRQFRTALMEERSKQSIVNMVNKGIARLVRRPKGLLRRPKGLLRRPVGIAFGGVAVFVIGVVLGYTLFVPPVPTERSMTEIMFEKASSMQSGSRITNVRFSDMASNEGIIDLSFDALTPVHVKGNINDQRVQRILAYALMSSQNPGTRLQTANILAAQTTVTVTHDADIRGALITALETDENPGVRREALVALQKFPYDEQVKHAYLAVLMKDKNSGMRIGVINALTRVQAGGLRLDSDVISVLQKKMQSDENTYIRARATNFLEGVQQ